MHVDASSFVLKSKLASLKAGVYKLVPVPIGLSKLSDVVKNDVKKFVYDKLVTKVNSIDASGFALKANEIPDTNGDVKKTDYNH